MKFTVKINNLPTHYEKYTYFVCREFDGELWFYGAWYATQEAEATQQAREVDGIVVKGEVL